MLCLSESWRFIDIQENIETIRGQYIGILSSFLRLKVKDRVNILTQLKRQVYGFKNIQYWQREKLWEVLNGDFDVEEFRRLCK